MIQKIQTLQKSLIAKSEEVVEKEIEIQDNERIYVELKQISARQPGPEVAEQLNIYENSLREKTEAMRVSALHVSDAADVFTIWPLKGAV